jgi:hypothetical protein
MEKNDIIMVFCFDTEIGVLAWGKNRAVSFFSISSRFPCEQ